MIKRISEDVICCTMVVSQYEGSHAGSLFLDPLACLNENGEIECFFKNGSNTTLNIISCKIA
jgi:hypothetical protein